ncbi:hypothetical protein GGQ85_004294 [Nitrobacter vulgaris]|nr:hypothetical protein [Nitrobacter vulgaris]
MNSISTHLFGRAVFFYPHLALPTSRFYGLYDLAPARERLGELIDFGRLNDGPLRITIVAPDLQTGDPVLFNSQVETIRMEHLLASAGFLLNSVLYPSTTSGWETAVFRSMRPLIPFSK